MAPVPITATERRWGRGGMRAPRSYDDQGKQKALALGATLGAGAGRNNPPAADRAARGWTGRCRVAMGLPYWDGAAASAWACRLGMGLPPRYGPVASTWTCRLAWTYCIGMDLFMIPG